MASEQMLFENVDNDERRTMDACLYHKLTYDSGELTSLEYYCWDNLRSCIKLTLKTD